jgi:hypothetical protein
VAAFLFGFCWPSSPAKPAKPGGSNGRTPIGQAAQLGAVITDPICAIFGSSGSFTELHSRQRQNKTSSRLRLGGKITTDAFFWERGLLVKQYEARYE